MLRRLALLFALLAGAVLLVLGQLGSALAAQVDRPFLQMVSGLGFEGALDVYKRQSWYPRDRRRKVRNWAVEAALEEPKVVELTPLVYPLL